MVNSKKILMVISASLLGLGLSGCGKDNYNGQYTGSEIKIPQQQPQNSQVPNQWYPTNNVPMQQQYRQVTVNLAHNGDIVTGDYTVTNSMMGGYQNPMYPNQGGMGGETYRLEASARSANRLDDVRLIPMNNMYSSMGGCVLQGALDAVDDGARLQGTLQPVNVNTQMGAMSWCLPTQITLDRVGNR